MTGTNSVSEAGVLFKGRMMTLTVLEIRETDTDRIADQVDAQIARAPGFFARMPVLLSFPANLPDLTRVCGVLRAADLTVVGVLDAEGKTTEAAKAAGLGVLSSPGRGASAPDAEAAPSRKTKPETAETRPDSAAERKRPVHAPPEAPAGTPTRLVTKPVRSGQQVYARGGDLIIATSVSEGAEVLADGHIHVYGALRGRALAGASGDTEARIYCKRFEPDLVAIAGCYKVADAIDEGVRSKSVQVRLDNDNLMIELQE